MKTTVSDNEVQSVKPVLEEEAVPWFLLQLKPSGFARAVMNLERQSVRTFMPLCPFSDVSSKAMHPQPLFPGYLFVCFDPLKVSFTTINSTFGVSRIVTFGCDALRGLSPKLIEGLQSRCDRQGYLMPLDDLKVNETVCVTAGPFAKFVAVVEQLSGQDRVKVLFEIMGQAVRAEISTNNLERASPS